MDRSNIEETSYEAQRLARRERMKEEKRRQAAARAMLKKLLPLVITGLIAIVVLIGAIVWGVRSLVDRHEVREQEESLSLEQEIVQQAEVVEVTPEPEPEIKNMLPVTVERPDLFAGYKVDASSADVSITEEEVQSQYASLINATTGKVLVTRNGNDRMNPASMTKVMTALVACEHITDLNEKFTVTVEDTDFAYVHDLSCAGFEAGETVPIKDILYGAIMPSGGECCHALERFVAGSEEEFIGMMNDKVAELGLSGTHFTNSAGLFGDDHYTTLYDISMIMKAAVENDICREVLHEHLHVTTPTEQHPEGLELSNWFMRRIEDKYSKTEVMGAKTGYVVQSGNCAVSYTIGDDGTVYICATGNAHSAWRAIFDHVALYEKYVQ
ncbi:MAG: D-alanyl-D-alanine carboxypeptidase [Lachnospiraceae bacterium]|nr:D-alanyl-D-alanine carboxypeptidase [Lachnospiraceae bacterium]